MFRKYHDALKMFRKYYDALKMFRKQKEETGKERLKKSMRRKLERGIESFKRKTRFLSSTTKWAVPSIPYLRYVETVWKHSRTYFCLNRSKDEMFIKYNKSGFNAFLC